MATIAKEVLKATHKKGINVEPFDDWDPNLVYSVLLIINIRYCDLSHNNYVLTIIQNYLSLLV